MTENCASSQPAVIVEETVEEVQASPAAVARADAGDDASSRWDSDDDADPVTDAVDAAAFITETPAVNKKQVID